MFFNMLAYLKRVIFKIDQFRGHVYLKITV